MFDFNLHFCFPGLSDIAAGGDFRWVDCTTAGPELFDNWAPGQPSDRTGEEDCVSGNIEQGGYNDRNCDLSLPYICEIQPKGQYCCVFHI